MMNATVKKTRIRNPEYTRQKLIDTAVELIAEKGVEGLSYKEVVERAEISRSGAYLHFADRDQLIAEVKNWIKSKLLTGVTEPDDEDTLYERILLTTKLVLEFPEAARVMMADALGGNDLGLADPLYKAVNSRMKKSMKSGYMNSDLDVEVTTFIHLGSICSTLLFAAQHPTRNRDKLAERFAKQWCEILEHSIIKQDSPANP